MSEDSTTQCLLFQGIFRKPVVAQFDQREGSSDGGALLLKAADRHYGLVRHEDVSTTQAHYLMLKSKAEGNAAMKRLERIVRQKLDRQARRKRKSPVNTA
jgi:hypothetical protein